MASFRYGHRSRWPSRGDLIDGGTKGKVMAQHEIRVALVMNGGVSLAVWMAGVTHELDLIRRASTPGTPPAQPYDLVVAARWRDLMNGNGARGGGHATVERHLVVDVIA